MEPGVFANWGNFLVGTATAAAALAGLVFVALSINLNRILSLPGVSGRAAETLITLAGALLGALIALVPGTSAKQLGVAWLVVAIPIWAVPVRLQWRALRARQYHALRHEVGRVVMHQVATLPGVVAGAALWGSMPGGVYWFAGGAMLSLAVALLNAWVLLVEIMR